MLDFADCTLDFWPCYFERGALLLLFCLEWFRLRMLPSAGLNVYRRLPLGGGGVVRCGCEKMLWSWCIYTNGLRITSAACCSHKIAPHDGFGTPLEVVAFPLPAGPFAFLCAASVSLKRGKSLIRRENRPVGNKSASRCFMDFFLAETPWHLRSGEHCGIIKMLYIYF